MGIQLTNQQHAKNASRQAHEGQPADWDRRSAAVCCKLSRRARSAVFRETVQTNSMEIALRTLEFLTTYLGMDRNKPLSIKRGVKETRRKGDRRRFAVAMN